MLGPPPSVSHSLHGVHCRPLGSAPGGVVCPNVSMPSARHFSLSRLKEHLHPLFLFFSSYRPVMAPSLVCLRKRACNPYSGAKHVCVFPPFFSLSFFLFTPSHLFRRRRVLCRKAFHPLFFRILRPAQGAVNKLITFLNPKVPPTCVGWR